MLLVEYGFELIAYNYRVLGAMRTSPRYSASEFSEEAAELQEFPPLAESVVVEPSLGCLRSRGCCFARHS